MATGRAGITRRVVQAPLTHRPHLARLDSEAMAVQVLIVDDQEPFRMAARLVVEATDGFDVAAEVETGEAAVETARELSPDLILMDVNLPGISGLEATQRILAETRDKQPVVVLVLSTYEAAEYAPRAAEAGAASYIPKSEFDPDRLEAAWAAAAPGGAAQRAS